MFYKMEVLMIYKMEVLMVYTAGMLMCRGGAPSRTCRVHSVKTVRLGVNTV
jgi:hypothetical protein